MLVAPTAILGELWQCATAALSPPAPTTMAGAQDGEPIPAPTPTRDALNNGDALGAPCAFVRAFALASIVGEALGAPEDAPPAML